MQFKNYTNAEINELLANRNVKDLINFYDNELATSENEDLKLYASTILQIIDHIKEEASINDTNDFKTLVETLQASYKVGLSLGYLAGLKQ